MIVAAQPGPDGPGLRGNDHGCRLAASERRGHPKGRGGAEEPRGGLTAAGRWGRRETKALRELMFVVCSRMPMDCEVGRGMTRSIGALLV